MAAEDFSESTRSGRCANRDLFLKRSTITNTSGVASTIYHCIRGRIVDTSISPDNKLPLVYVLDSLLKNVKGVYVDIILDDASNWMSAVYNIFDEASNKENEKARLKRVWDSWRQQGVVKDDSRWKKIGECFSAPVVKQTVPASPVIDLVSGGGFPRNADGSLKIETELRKQMQLLLDDVQSSGIDELDKVSLERLAEINPDLLQQIKEGAEAAIIDLNKTTTSQTRPQHQAAIPGTKSVAAQAPHQSEWDKLNIKHTEQSNKLITSLHQQVISASQSTTVVKSELDDVVHLYASVSASAQIMTDMLQQFTSGANIFGGDCDARSGKRRRYSIVKPEDFTNDGIKKRNDAVIAQVRYPSGCIDRLACTFADIFVPPVLNNYLLALRGWIALCMLG